VSERKIRLAAVAVIVLALGPVTAATRAEAESREEALSELRNRESAEVRRRGVLALAESGTMSDLPVLVQALRDTDPAVRTLADSALWQIWSRSGDGAVDEMLTLGIQQMTARQGQAAVATFTRVIERKPDFAEGWNKRATVYFLLGEYEKSLADCDEVMKRNPYHYGALSGYGMIYLAQGRREDALRSFERALAINPNLGSLREAVEELRQELLQRRRDSI